VFKTYSNPVYEYIKSPDQDSSSPAHHPLIIIGAGPVGMAAAIDAGQRNIPTLVIDKDNTVSVGSRAVCYSKRALEVLDRLKCAKPMIDKGVTWKVGKIFFQDGLVHQFDLLPDKNHKIPAFINLQQYYLEEYMVKRMAEISNIEVRWKNCATAINNDAEKVTVYVDTPDGKYQMTCDWLIVADGANSPIREHLGLESTGQWFRDRFLIADIIMKADFPAERWFSFDPSYHRGQSTLLHKQADNVWRLDFQLGWDTDPDEEMKPENVIPRVKAMLGEDTDFELEWCSVYTFRCRRMDKFRYNRTLFVGDAAHQVSPFGARGANSGIQDTDNLIWKLKLVMEGVAPASFLDSYSDERVYAADENILNSTRATDFITPKSKTSRIFRNSVLELARTQQFAQSLVNSGRLSDTAFLTESILNTPDTDDFSGKMVPGAVMDDAPIIDSDGEQWLLNVIGDGFTLLYFIDDVSNLNQKNIDDLLKLSNNKIKITAVIISKTSQTIDGLRLINDKDGLVAKRYDAISETTYLIRPDQHVAARWRNFDLDKVTSAALKATGNN